MERAAWQRIADVLRRRIADGTYEPGQRMPSYRDLALEQNVSQIVTKRSYLELVTEGLVEVRLGSGHYVRKQPVLRDTRRWYHRGRRSPFAAEQRAAGHRPDWDVDTTVIEAGPEVAARLGIEPGEAVVRSKYVFIADGAPVMLSISHESHALTGGTPVEHPEEGPYAGWGVTDRMDVIGVRCTHVVEKPSARPATADEAVKLQIPVGTPVMRIERTYYAGDRPVETAIIVAPGDRYRPVYEIPVVDE